MNKKVMELKGVTEESLAKVFKRYDVTLVEDELIVKGPEKSLEGLEKVKDKLLIKHVGGISGITQITVNFDNGEWVLYTRGSKLDDVLLIPEVDTVRTTTNDIHQIADVLGIEAARNAIIKELMSVLEEQGLDVDIRHLMLIADLMTRTGKIRQTGRYGVVAEKESVLARAAFEITVPILRKAAVRGEEDHLRGVTENLVVGTKVPIGTGLVEVYMKGKI